MTLDLMKTMDPNDSGNQKQRGNLTVELNYKPFKEDDMADIKEGDEDEEMEGAPEGVPAGGGLLVVIIHEAEEVEGKHHTNPFVRIVFKGEEKRTKVYISLHFLSFQIKSVLSHDDFYLPLKIETTFLFCYDRTSFDLTWTFIDKDLKW